MKTLAEVIKEAQAKHIALGHFNVSDVAALKAVFQSAKNLNVPVIIGVSEGERKFLGVKTISGIIRSLREEFDYPLFLNADHTYTLEGVQEAVIAGFDSIIFDGSRLSFKENVQRTKEAVRYVKANNKNILVEGELGHIGASSEVLKKIPRGAQITENQLTKPAQAKQFVQETKVDLFAPAVGNLHGMLKNTPEPALNIERIRKIKEAVGIPLVLHGGSGNTTQEFQNAIAAGVSIIHISTELRKAWREGIEESLKNQPDEVAPYRLLSLSVEKIQAVAENHLKIFNSLA